MKRRIALFGGTFDPIHCGHMCVASHAAEQIGAHTVVFIPTKRSPHKKLFPVAGGQARLEMIRLATEGQEGFQVSDCELKRCEPSYTLDTVGEMSNEYGRDNEFYWLVGADMVGELDKWYKICELIDVCNLSVMLRGGVDRPDFTRFERDFGAERVEKLERNVISTPLVNISGTEIRRRVADRQNIKGLVDVKVLAYIEKNVLYRS